MDIKTKLSMLWIVLLFDLIFEDMLYMLVELVEENILDIIAEIKTTMAIAVLLTNISILMIYSSGQFSYKVKQQ